MSVQGQYVDQMMIEAHRVGLIIGRTTVAIITKMFSRLCIIIMTVLTSLLTIIRQRWRNDQITIGMID